MTLPPYLQRLLSAPYVERLLTAFKVDFPDNRSTPPAPTAVFASVVAIAGSLAADAFLAALAIALMPASRNYEHFQFLSYAKLTVIGVIIACVAWPVTCAITSAPRWLFSRMAVLVTLVLLLPDLWIYIQGQPGRYVDVLVLMHIAIAVITYVSLTRIAAARVPKLRSVAHSDAA